MFLSGKKAGFSQTFEAAEAMPSRKLENVPSSYFLSVHRGGAAVLQFLRGLTTM
jgi:hypothetical protein